MCVASPLPVVGRSQADAECVVQVLQRTTPSSGAGDENTKQGLPTTSALAVQITLGHYIDAGAIPVSHPGISGFVRQGMHHDHLAVEGAGLAGLVTTFGKSRAIWATTTPTVRWPGAWFKIGRAHV